MWLTVANVQRLLADQEVAALRELPEREVAILLRRSDGRTLQDIGDEFGLTRERVRQLQNRALRRIGGWPGK